MRPVLSLLAATLLVAWADAQQAGALLTAGERGKQFQSNRVLLEKMVSHSVKLSNSNDGVARSVACKAAMSELVGEIDTAITARDVNRVAELGDYLNDIISNGLIPTISEANVPEGSPEELRLKELHKQTTEEFTRLDKSVLETEKLAGSSVVQETLTRWQATRTSLAKVFKSK